MESLPLKPIHALGSGNGARGHSSLPREHCWALSFPQPICWVNQGAKRWKHHRDPSGLQAFLVQSFMLEGLQGRGQWSCSDEQPTEEEMRRREEMKKEENRWGGEWRKSRWEQEPSYMLVEWSSPLTHISLSWSHFMCLYTTDLKSPSPPWASPCWAHTLSIPLSLIQTTLLSSFSTSYEISVRDAICWMFYYYIHVEKGVSTAAFPVTLLFPALGMQRASCSLAKGHQLPPPWQLWTLTRQHLSPGSCCLLKSCFSPCFLYADTQNCCQHLYQSPNIYHWEIKDIFAHGLGTKQQKELPRV